MKNLLQTLALTLFSSSAIAQITPQLFIDTTYTPEALVTDFFSNASITSSNVVYTGSPRARGYFDAGVSDLPISAGIVLSTGRVNALPGQPSDLTSLGNSIFIFDADLFTIVPGGAQYDLARLEFDIVPQVDTIRLFYIFGSEEYPEFVNTAFNDVFGIFISGGPEYAQAANIALIPNTNTGVSINTVNEFENSEYYIPWAGQSGSFCVLDATTTLLQAVASVTPGQTYHLKIAIADIVDFANDSGVFIGIQSLEGDSLLTPPADFAFAISNDTLFLTNQSKYAVEYDWDFGDGVYSSQKNPGFHAYDPLADTVYVQLVTRNWCCSDTIVKMLSLKGAPDASLSASANLICQGASVHFAGAADENTITEWYWEFPGGIPAFSNEPNPLVSYPSPGLFSVKLTLVNDQGFQNTKEIVGFVSVQSAQIFPSAAFSFEQNGPWMQFTAAGTNASHFSWSLGDGTLSELPTLLHAYQDTGYFEVALIASNVCHTNTMVQQVYFDNYVMAHFSASPTAGCAPLSVQFTNETDHTTVSHWSFPGGDPENSDEPNPTVTYWYPGLYDVVLLAGTAPFSHEAHYAHFIEALPSPSADFELTLSGLTVNVNNLSANASQYFWDFGDGASSEEENPEHTYEEPGDYHITLIATNECGTDTSIATMVISSLAQPGALDGWFEIFPNPVESELFIQPLRDAAFSLRIFDATGRPVFNGKRLEQRQGINLGAATSGMYWIEIKTEGRIFVEQVIIR